MSVAGHRDPPDQLKPGLFISDAHRRESVAALYPPPCAFAFKAAACTFCFFDMPMCAPPSPQGESAAVAEAVFEAALPRNAGDMLPSSPPGILVAIADRLDSLVGMNTCSSRIPLIHLTLFIPPLSLYTQTSASPPPFTRPPPPTGWSVCCRLWALCCSRPVRPQTCSLRHAAGWCEDERGGGRGSLEIPRLLSKSLL